jgi:hypothetical protein
VSADVGTAAVDQLPVANQFVLLVLVQLGVAAIALGAAEINVADNVELRIVDRNTALRINKHE